MGAEILGYGEISSVFSLRDDSGRKIAVKRLPVFNSREEIEEFKVTFMDYNQRLRDCGLLVPDGDVTAVRRKNGAWSAYVLQESLEPSDIASTGLAEREAESASRLFRSVLLYMAAVWQKNEGASRQLLGLDGQISNWAFSGGTLSSGLPELIYIDTSTPFIRMDGREQFRAEILLQSAPAGLRVLLKKMFLQEILDRYYRFQDVITDLGANLIKEGASRHLPLLVNLVNSMLDSDLKEFSLREFTVEDIENYYRRDKFIWQLFLAARRADRWLQTRIFRRRYEFLLPEIKQR